MRLPESVQLMRELEVDMAYVIRKGGKYLRYTMTTTHTGTHRCCDWYADINSSTLFHHDPRGVEGLDEEGIERLEAVEARVVVLVQGEREHIDLRPTITEGGE